MEGRKQRAMVIALTMAIITAAMALITALIPRPIALNTDPWGNCKLKQQSGNSERTIIINEPGKFADEVGFVSRD